MTKQYKIIWGIFTIAALPVIGFAITYGSTLLADLESQSLLYYGVFSLAIILVLLPIPYFMIKMLGHVAHIQNPAEKEISLSDLPKDKEELRVSLHS